MMKAREDLIQNSQLRGEWAELCFMAQAAERGLNVSRPHGESASYDVGVEHKGRFLRVQVKSTTYLRGRAFSCKVVGPKHEPYARGTVDFFAVYLVPLDLWYIIPFEAVKRNVSLSLTPLKGQKYAQYLEAWHTLRGEERAERRGRERHRSSGNC